MLKLRLMLLVAAVVGAGGVFAGCDDEELGCTAGTEACACNAGACNPGLTCAANKCVSAGGGMDGGGTGGTGGGGRATPPTPAGARAATPAARPAPSRPIPTQICADMQTYCERFNACAPYYIGLEFGTVAKCTERLTLQCLDAVMAPGSGLDGTTMVACTAALATASCDDLFNRNVPACNFKGTRANGMACGADEQCTSGRCAKTTGACGMCADHVADDARLRSRRGLRAGPAVQRGRSLRGARRAPGHLQRGPALPYGFSCVAAACQPAVTTAGGVLRERAAARCRTGCTAGPAPPAPASP